MSVLLVNSKSDIGVIIKESMNEMRIELSFIDEPQEADETYLASMLSVVKSQNVNCVFSIGFFPYISLACGALNLPYISWIIDSSPEVYDYSIKNDWNEVYIADINAFLDLQKRGIENITYLPLAPTISFDDEVGGEMADEAKDLLIWADLDDKSRTLSDTLKNLLDATKGYLDGMIEQRKCDLSSWSLYEECADYIKRDVEKNYPVSNDSFESTAHKYDFSYLLPLLDNEYAIPYIKYILAPWKNIGHVDLACDASDEQWSEEKIVKVARNNIRDGKYGLLREYKFVIFFPDIRNGNKLSLDIWNAMAAGAFVVVPRWIDVDAAGFSEIKRFKNTNELNDIIVKYINKPEERRKYTEDIKNRVNQQGTISDRIKKMFDSSHVIL